MDNSLVTEEDLGGQFFLSEDDVGKRSRAEASVAGLQVAACYIIDIFALHDAVLCDFALNSAVRYLLLTWEEFGVTFPTLPNLPDPLQPCSRNPTPSLRR